MNGYSKAVLVVSDPHCGSIFGMLPPDFTTSDDKTVGQNVGQKHLWQCWVDMGQAVAAHPIVAVVVNGDVIDGAQGAQRGTELALPMLADQALAAEMCLRDLRGRLKERAKWYFVQGTEYHDSAAGREVESVARGIGATPYVGPGTGRYSREALDLDVDGVVLNFAHHISASGGLYRATAPDREGVWSALGGKEGKVPRADVVVRSHVHCFTHVEHPSKHVVVTPCWQLQTRFMRRKSYYRMVPDIGVVLLWIDGAAKKKGEDPVVVQKLLYPLPPLKPVKL
jgi:hypothetical protein